MSGLNFNVKKIVRHYQYADIENFLHQAREAELQVADDAKYLSRSSFGQGSFSSRATPSDVQSSVAPSSCGATSRKSISAAPSTKPTVPPTTSATGSSSSTARTRDMSCHTCGGKGHLERDCPNKKVMLVNEETGEYESGDEVDH